MALQEHRTVGARSLPSPAAGVPAHVIVRVTDAAGAAAWFARVAGLHLPVAEHAAPCGLRVLLGGSAQRGAGSS